jgi:Flp pilus assembly protein TadD
MTTPSSKAVQIDTGRPRFSRLAMLAGGGAILVAAALLVRARLPTSRAARPAPAPAVTAPPAADVAGAQQLNSLEVRALQRPKDPELALELAQAYAARNRAEEALEQFRRAQALRPDLIPARVGQGQMWMRLKRPGPAAEAFDWAVGKLPDNPQLRLELGAAYLELRDLPEAIRQIRRATELAPEDAEPHRALATAYAQVFAWDRATVQAKKATELGAGDPKNWSTLGSVLFKAGKHAEAAEALRTAVELDPRDATANLQLARALHSTQDPGADNREAMVLLTRALVLDPGNHEALYLLGQIHLDAGQLDLAVSTLRRAREADPENPRPLLLLGQATLRSGDTAAGRRMIAEAQVAKDKTVDVTGLEFQAARNPNPNIQLRLAELYIQQRYFDSAVHLLEKAVRRSPGVPQLRQALAQASSLATAQKMGEARAEPRE